MSLLRDALKRAEELKRAQQQAPLSSETQAADLGLSPAAFHITTAPKLDLALSQAPPSAAATPTAERTANSLSPESSPLADRTTPSRPRDRTVPGTMSGPLRPATEAIMRRDAQNLSAARAAHEFELLNAAEYDAPKSSAPLHNPTRAATASGETTNLSAPAEKNPNLKPELHVEPAVATVAAAHSKLNKPASAAAEALASVEKNADRDTVKRMMAQRIAAEAEAMQNIRTRTLTIGGGAALLLVAVGGWYVWKETHRYGDSTAPQTAGMRLRLSPSPNANGNSNSNANTITPPPTALLTTTLPVTPNVAITAAVPSDTIAQANPASSTNPTKPDTSLKPVNPNSGQIPQPILGGNDGPKSSGVALVPPMSSAVPSKLVSLPAATSASTRQVPVASNTQRTLLIAPSTQVLPPPPIVSVASDAASTNNRNKTNPQDIQSKVAITPLRQGPAPRIVTTSSKLAAPPSAALMAGYAALLAGNAARALTHYAEAAQATPDNIDAQLGLAISAARINEPNIARKAFARALELDPRNGQASAGLLLLASNNNANGNSNTRNNTTETANAEDTGASDTISNMASFARQERELKMLLQSTPQSASLSFSLGNLYASQKRWTDAQQAFFDAFAVDPNNADFAYNLAVSLDQLNQPKLALRYYERALTLKAEGRGGQFLASQATARATQLSGSAPPISPPKAEAK